ncbi:unnamed protein product [Sphagnum balticum]
MLEGCDALANAVQVTLGPNGRNVLIDQSYGGVKITKDGVTVAKAIEFSDRFANMGANLVKSVASKTNDEAGDGTTTATVLARAIFREALKRVETGVNLSELKKVKAPSFGDNRKAILNDIAILTGGTVISEDVGVTFEDSDESVLGTVGKVEITKEDTVLLHGNGDKVQDAICATRAAIAEGIVVGGGSALLYAGKILDTLKGENAEQDLGIKIIKKAISLPCKTISDNAGFEGVTTIDRVLNSTNTNFGFDANKGEFVDLIARGIIDPTKVVRVALEDAASVSSLMTTTECMIVDKDEPRPSGGAGGAGGFGGMGGGMGGMY